MKKLIRFFVFIYKWIVALFSSKPKVKQQEFEAENKEIDRRRFSHRNMPKHNNRKNTRGRYAQHMHGRPTIFHDSRNTSKKV
jgi:hypothetical protein